MVENLKEILSPRQYEVIVGLAQGLDNSEIANSMGTTAGNVSMLLSTICKRLGIKSMDGISLREQLVDYVNNCPEFVRSENASDCDEEEWIFIEPENNDTVSNIQRISESVENIEIVQKIKSTLMVQYIMTAMLKSSKKLENIKQL